MAATRIFLTLGKPMSSALKSWTSGVTKTMAASCGRRHVTTGRNYFLIRAATTQSERLLDPLVGSWKEISCQGLEKFLEVSGLTKPQQEQIMEAKMELSYSRQDGLWTVESRFPKLNLTTTYRLTIGERFRLQMPFSYVMDCLVTQDGTRWIENYDSVDKLPPMAMTVTNEVHGDVLKSVAIVKDAALERVFARDAAPRHL